ncbi:hypothetical protein N7540_008699 [Penicillium herquei]|nr:hypothetical protein N7540_008699 [Penicillium herquei]
MCKEDLEAEGDDEHTEDNCDRAEMYYLSKHQDEDRDEDEYKYEDWYKHERNPSFNFLSHQNDETDNEENPNDDSEDEEDVEFDNFE